MECEGKNTNDLSNYISYRKTITISRFDTNVTVLFLFEEHLIEDVVRWYILIYEFEFNLK